MDEKEEIDYEMTDEVVCPYCGYTFDDSSEFINEGEDSFEVECDECNRSFGVSVYRSVTFTSIKRPEGEWFQKRS